MRVCALAIRPFIFSNLKKAQGLTQIIPDIHLFGRSMFGSDAIHFACEGGMFLIKGWECGMKDDAFNLNTKI